MQTPASWPWCMQIATVFDRAPTTLDNQTQLKIQPEESELLSEKLLSESDELSEAFSPDLPQLDPPF